jgi:UDP-glucose 4-epimerase
MNILALGGAGYIGSHVVRAFLDAGNAVTVFDNLSSGRRENLFPDGAFVHGDVLDYDALRRVMAGMDAVLHFAALKAAGESMRNPEAYSRTNLTGAVNIVNAMSAAGVKYIVFSSSAAVYGETTGVPVREDSPLAPTNYYGFTKLAVERLLAWYDKLRGLRFAALRYFNAAGYDTRGRIWALEYAPANLIPVVMETATGLRPEVEVFGNDYDTPDGTCIRDYVHVDDLAAAHCAALDYIAREDKSLTVNLGSERGVSVREVIETARRVTGRSIPVRIGARRQGDPARLTASAGLARETLGWRPRFSDIETLLQSTWAVSSVYPHIAD